MPASGRFFADWNNDCTVYNDTCREAGRSPCDGGTIEANRHVVTIPASVWNSWLGASGNTMTVRVTGSSAMYTAPLEERSLALYCENLGFNQCPGQSCDGLCGPETFSRVSISYTAVPQTGCIDSGDCDNGNFCDGVEYCDGNGECQDGNYPCQPGKRCCETLDSCKIECCKDSDCSDDEVCNLTGGGVCVECLTDADCKNNTFCDGVEICNSNNECEDGSNPCSNGQHCCEETRTCNNVCCYDSHCGSPNVCDANNDACVFCKIDSDCAYGKFCNNGMCSTAQPCTANAQCEPSNTMECIDYTCTSPMEFIIAASDGQNYSDTGAPWRNSSSDPDDYGCEDTQFRVALPPTSAWANEKAYWHKMISTNEAGIYRISVGFQASQARSEHVQYDVEIRDEFDQLIYRNREEISQYWDTLIYCQYESFENYYYLPSGCFVYVILRLDETAAYGNGSTNVMADTVKFTRLRRCLHKNAPYGESCDDGIFCNGKETCRSGVCRTSSANRCDTDEVCDAISDRCKPDCNHNDIPDEDDIDSGYSQDCDGNANPDDCDLDEGYHSDCNNNGIPDSCDVSSETSNDCDENFKPDECDLSTGNAKDCNGNLGGRLSKRIYPEFPVRFCFSDVFISGCYWFSP